MSSPNDNANSGGLTTPILIADNIQLISGISSSPDGLGQLTRIGGSPAAIALEIQSITGGLIVPRMTAAQQTLQNGFWLDGTVVYITDGVGAGFQFRELGSWIDIPAGGIGNVTFSGTPPVGQFNIPIFSDTTGTNIIDSGMTIVPAGTVFSAPSVVGNTLENISVLNFVSTNVGTPDSVIKIHNATTSSTVALAGIFSTTRTSLADSANMVISNINNATPSSAGAIFEIQSTNATFLNARMTAAQKGTIPAPTNGMQIYQTDGTPGFYFYQQGSWIQFQAAGGSGITGIDQGGTNNNIFVGIGSGNAGVTGIQNTSLGYQALQNISSGNGNVAIAYQALQATTTGVRNIAIGETALKTSTQSDSIAIGDNALNSFVGNSGNSTNIAIGSSNLTSLLGVQANSGTNNIAIGVGSMINLIGSAAGTAFGNIGIGDGTLVSIVGTATGDGTEGSMNIAIGYQTLRSTTGRNNVCCGYEVSLDHQGNDNCVFGSQSWNQSTSADRNCSIGSRVGMANINGVDCIGIGTETLFSTVHNSRLIAIGTNAMQNANGADDVIAIGYNSLLANSGTRNIAIGNYALVGNTSGTDNLAIGYNALNALSNASASHNIAIGSQCMPLLTNGSDNVAIGYNALPILATGSFNLCIGDGALALLTSGSNNAALGEGALAALGTGNGNMAFGYHALNVLASGTSNSALGINALALLTSGTGNAVIGAGLVNLTTGSGNLAIGQAVGPTPTSGLTDCTLIGNTADCSDGLTNAIVIGYGATSTVSNSCILGNGCNVGIGTNAPQASLHVAGGQIVKQRTITNSQSVLGTDYVIFADTTGGALTATLPAAASATAGQEFTVKDKGGMAGTNNITIATAGGNIDNSATAVINTNFGSLSFISDGTNYYVI